MKLRKTGAVLLSAAMLIQCMTAGISAENYLSDPIVSYEEDNSFYSEGVSEDTEKKVYDRIITEYEKGSASDTGFSYSAGSEGISIPSAHSLVQLDDGLINYTSAASTFAETVCEEKGGAYFVSGKDLIFYSLTDFTSKVIKTFSYIKKPYFANNKLYYLSNDSCIVYDLITDTEVMTFKPELSSLIAVGADAQGRIYIAGRSSDDKYCIILYTPQGTELSRMERDEAIYDIYGFNSKNGDFYFEAFCNWKYWGYDHYGKSVNIGNVTDNVITEKNVGSSVNMGGLSVGIDGVEFIAQNYYSPAHQRNADLIDDNYLITVSSAFGRKLLIDPVGYKSYGSLDNFKGDQYTAGAYGTRTVYFPYNDTIITSDEGNDIIEYSPKEERTLGSFTAAHPIFSVMRTGKNIILLEKENDIYYIETVKWAGSSELSIDANAVMMAGESQKAVITGNSAVSESYIFSSDNPSVASVSDEGVIAAWSTGTAVISCRSEFGSGSDSVTVTVTAANIPAFKTSTEISGKVSKNISQNNYTVYGKTVKSYLYENADGTFTRVEYIDGLVYIEKYSKDNRLLNTQKISPELPVFGGFFSGRNYNFLVFGQNNTNDSDTFEVMRVVKYDKSWNRLGSFSAYGANTYIPFDAGSLRMDETGDDLYIYTCHEMFKSSDGYHHQANMTFVISQSEMAEKQSYYDVMNVSYGYVSHSFNQFVKTDGKYVYRMDHGDAHPRGYYISRCSVDGKITSVSYLIPMSFSGSAGNNYTGASLGGMELSGSKIIAVGNSIDHESETASLSGARNVFAFVISKDLEAYNTVWLTDYDENSDITARTPQLVKITDEHFLVMWEEYNNKNGRSSLQSALMNSSGQVVSLKKLSGYAISDCQPIVTSYGTVKWYVTDGNTAKMYEYYPFEGKTIDPIEAFVDRLYTIILGRHAEAAGLADWTNRLKTGTATSAEIVYGIIFSPEYGNKGLSNSEAIERLYQAMLGRASDAEGKQYWLNNLAGGLTITGIINGFSGSQEFGQICASYGIKAGNITDCEPRDRNIGLTGFVSRMYTKALGRNYDVDGLNDWTNQYLTGTATTADIAYGFIFSEEFLNKNLSDEAYVETLYATFFDRPSDATGKADWLDRMHTQGYSREMVLDGFLEAPEFITLREGFGV